MFFSFDGLDGVGKTTQIALFRQWLEQNGEQTIVCRDPGSTPLGETIRQLLLTHDDNVPIGRRAEMLLYMAARAQLIQQVIRPALDSGASVISDRYVLANLVYQGYAGGLDVEAVREVGRITTEGLSPHLIVLLDMDPARAHDRLKRDLDRMEQQGSKFRQQIRAGFLAEAERDERIVVVDAARSVEAIQQEIRRAAQDRLPELASWV